jgi:hypothetical protein
MTQIGRIKTDEYKIKKTSPGKSMKCGVFFSLSFRRGV